ncbi:Outer membrane lipoprotein-sorting protein [Alkalithermobacter thermoalcaliphilus JW-YL-7 = DSM 7308]|uniref:Outer membrane lipoprotein-sorting protein n=1 Tax=Alkalithermobacter thermoalcaliphilus JW-YL-7 = DSM 7308 TaxID=1121328 RepID=A0A150FSA4_CLOPD|nr:hypothetical protein JWYL7_1557 [[Clostridium] paradoxum JW-YL-7 = DSM 7308]SHL16457.1 Outer membrane lipoprotein-sorting protein [[Clostridium] paradoxum JW-YL-7 = DSM 7308]
MKNKEEIVSALIDDINKGKNPSLNEQSDQELKEILQTIKIVKEFGREDIMQFRKKRISNSLKVASILAFILVTINILLLFPNRNDNNIVYSMEKAYSQIESYFGIIEIISQTGNDIESKEKITVYYKKDDKYNALHEIQGYKTRQISDGEKIYTINGKNVTIEYTNPKRELWRYHIQETIDHMKNAIDIQKTASEVVSGRKTDVYKFRYSKDEPFNRIWIDKETNMPIRKEINTNENSKVINTFVKLDINPYINDSLFTYEIKSDDVVTYINKKIPLDNIVESDMISKIPEGFDVMYLIQLQKDHIYDYLLRLKGDNSKFIDVYISLNSNKDFNIAGETINLGNNYIIVSENVVNLFKVYIGKINTVRYTQENIDILAVTNLNRQEIINISRQILK